MNLSGVLTRYSRNGKDVTGRGGRHEGGDGRETCTARFLAAMIGSGRQYLLNRCRVSRCGYFLLR